MPIIKISKIFLIQSVYQFTYDLTCLTLPVKLIHSPDTTCEIDSLTRPYLWNWFTHLTLPVKLIHSPDATCEIDSSQVRRLGDGVPKHDALRWGEVDHPGG